ncbi:hypothetical protein QBC43DRAFT_348462 [Cladorrhinum sp. PSN259]|nr:hypothetical protein QBC43DRAFT_348462 [Cladorrhinum sp. PSN259]
MVAGYRVHVFEHLPHLTDDGKKYINDHKLEYAKSIRHPLPESIGIQTNYLGLVDRYAPKDCIVATTTSLKSSLLLDKVSAERRKLICNVRFTLPREIRTVELMTDGETHERIFPFLTDVLKSYGMISVTLKKESMGYALTGVAEGVANPAQIDAVWASAMKAESVPCQAMDRVGLETVAHIEDSYIKERGLDGGFTVGFLRKDYRC